MISVSYPKKSATKFFLTLAGISYNFELRHNNFSDQLELVGMSANSVQIFRRNLVPSINMLFGYANATMKYIEDISNSDTIYLQVIDSDGSEL